MADFYRKALVWMRHEDQFFSGSKNRLRIQFGEANFYVNEFAKRKTEDMYMIESRFYALALEDPVKVIYEQMRWIGKEPDELQVLDSAYQKMREQEFVDFLVSVKDYDVDDMKQFKNMLVKEFRKEFFPDILSKNGTLSNEKLEEICGRFGLKLESLKDTKDRRSKYIIREMQQGGGEENEC